jgi:uncharacterized membrane protein
MKSSKTVKAVASAINAPLAFLLELAMLAAFGYFGFHAGDVFVFQLLLGIGIPLTAVFIWAKWLAPKAKERLKMPGLVAAKAILFGLAALALIAADERGASMWFTGAVALHMFLMLPSKQY